jgi:amino acid transporter
MIGFLLGSLAAACGSDAFSDTSSAGLTLAGSVFEMALYPNLCIDYIGQFAPGVVAGHRGLILGFAMIALCTAWNVLGVRSVGEGSVWLNVALLVPFVALTILALGNGKSAGAAPVPLRHADLLGGVLIAMWNYMGWDNLSTIAGEVEKPQRLGFVGEIYQRAKNPLVIQLLVIFFTVKLIALASLIAICLARRIDSSAAGTDPGWSSHLV